MTSPLKKQLSLWLTGELKDSRAMPEWSYQESQHALSVLFGFFHHKFNFHYVLLQLSAESQQEYIVEI